MFLLLAELVVFPIAAMHAVNPVAAGQTGCGPDELDPARPASRVGGTCEVLLGRWSSYRDAEYGIAFAYPRLWNDEGFEDCRVRRDQTGLWVGSRIEVAVVPAPDRTLDEWVEEFIAERTAEPYDWRVEAVGHRMVGEQAAQGISVDYRFGGLNRWGTATFVARGARIYALGFTAGGSACDAPGQGLTEIAAYQEMLASLKFLDESSASATQIVPLQIGPETELPDGIALIVEVGCAQCDGPTEGLARVYRDARGEVRVETLFGWGGPGHLADLSPPTGAAAFAGYPYIKSFALKADASELVVAFCTRGDCGFQGPASPDAQTALFRSLDGGVTWATWGVLDGRYDVYAITGGGVVVQGRAPGQETRGDFTLFPSGDPLSPPAEVAGPPAPGQSEARPLVLSTGELLWPTAGRLLRSDGTVFLAVGEGRRPAWTPSGILGGGSTGERLDLVVWEARGYSGVYTLLIVDQGRTINEFSLDGYAHIGGRLDSGLLVGNVSVAAEQLTSSAPGRFVEYLPALFDLDAGRAYPIAHPFLDPPLRNGRNHILAVARGPFARVIDTGGCLNVRLQPSAQAQVLACVADGVLLRHGGETSGEPDETWLRVVTPQGDGGWALALYLEYR